MTGPSSRSCALLVLAGLAGLWPHTLPAADAPPLVPQRVSASGGERGWWLPGAGPHTAHFEAGVAAHFGEDFFDWRNLQLRGQYNLPHGWRVSSVLRSNRELAGIGRFDPLLDEGYLEWHGYHFAPGGTFAFNARLGRMRYLRFPFPDRLAAFDVVPGIQDLAPLRQFRTALDGLLVNLDYRTDTGAGLHASAYRNSHRREPGTRLLESYLYYNGAWQRAELELRGGRLRRRTLPDPDQPDADTRQPRRSAWGASAYLGLRWRGFRIGAMLEHLDDEELTAGLLVQFTPGLITNLLGSFHADYTRDPEGIALHLPLLRGTYGYADPDSLPAGALPVGEVIAERRSTFWLNSQTRNFYEHEYSVAGRVEGEDLVVVCEAYPWYLKTESPVGRLPGADGFDELRDWDRGSARLGEVAQPVVYRYYRADQARRHLFLAPGIDFSALDRRFRFGG